MIGPQPPARAHLALHVGINAVDADAYGGFAGDLRGCEHDAASMREIAVENGFTAETLMGPEATAAALQEWLSESIEPSREEDTLLLTFAGYGGAVPDGRAPNALAETWAMFDRQLLHDELFALVARARPGVHVVIVADCSYQPRDDAPPDERLRTRSLPRAVARDQYARNEPFYEAIRVLTGSPGRPRRATSLLWLGGCQDNQRALESERHGLFTEALLAVYNDSTFDGDYAELLHRVVRRMPATQSPALRAIGGLVAPTAHTRAFRPE